MIEVAENDAEGNLDGFNKNKRLEQRHENTMSVKESKHSSFYRNKCKENHNIDV